MLAVVAVKSYSIDLGGTVHDGLCGFRCVARAEGTYGIVHAAISGVTVGTGTSLVHELSVPKLCQNGRHRRRVWAWTHGFVPSVELLSVGGLA